ncbi:MAG: hypothetical protein RMZ43_000555 [Nostoc sp. CmiVER01]|uniref:hypothetical protein n=1 Tax=Nostoc sp. CmiVER01 TaxID=3075384 RepID=UPI002AD35A45|nr:hypothetical protein [Nostoc sp. CmiVER01]MDZ8121958.1 hypothetical protein [Nostoc sp. CmiVER01]
MDILFSDRQLQLAYQGNVDLAAIAKVIPGIKDLSLDGLTLPVNNPRLTLSNLGTKNLKDIDFAFASDRLPKTELVNWLTKTVIAKLPQDVREFIKGAIAVVENLDVKFANNQIQITYLGDLNFKTILDKITTQLGDFLLPLKGLDLAIANPSITITNPQDSPSFSFSADRLPLNTINSVKTWLTNQVNTYITDESTRNVFTGLLKEISQVDLVLGDKQTQINYLGTVDLAKALRVIPGLSSLTPSTLQLPVLNPSFTVITNAKNRSYSLLAEQLPKKQLTEWLTEKVKALLPTEVSSIIDSLLNIGDRLDVELGNNQLQLSYKGNLDLAKIIAVIPGLKDLPLNGLQLPVLNPRFAITNLGKNASFSFAADQLPKQQLITWIKAQLPEDVRSLLDNISAVAQQLDVVMGNNQIQVTYNGAVDLVQVLGLIPGVKELLASSTTPLNIINPSLTIFNPGKNASFSFAAEKLPKKELLDLISSQLPADVKAVFDKLSANLDVVFAKDKIQLDYRGDIDLMQIANLIPGVKDLPLNGLALIVTNPSLTLINQGKQGGAYKFDYLLSAERLPVQPLITWVKANTGNVLPQQVGTLLDQLLAIGKDKNGKDLDINLILGTGQMQIAVVGDLDIVKVISLIPGVKDIKALAGLNLPVTNPSITIINPKSSDPNQKAQYLFKSDRLPKEELATWLTEQAKAVLPEDVVAIVNSLSAIAQGIDLEVSNDQIELSYEGTVELSDILKQIPGVKDLPRDQFKLPVLNPSLTISNLGANQKANYSFVADRLPKKELIDWLKVQGKELIPAELQSIFDTLSAIGEQLDVKVGDSQIQVTYQGDLKLVDIIKNIPGLSSFNSQDLTLNVKNPSITILNPGKKADFRFQAENVPILDLTTWLGNQAADILPQAAKDILKSLSEQKGNLNVVLDKNEIQVLYDGDFDLFKLLGQIDGVKTLTLPPAGSLLVSKPAFTITRYKDKPTDTTYKTDFNFTAEKLKKDGLKQWLIDQAGSALPQSVKDIVSALVDTAAEFDVLFKNNKLQISYPGTLDVGKIIQKIPGLSDLTTGLNLPITNPVLTIYDLNKGLSKANYTFAADHLPKEELVDWLTKQANAQLPQEVMNVVNDLLELARRLDVQLGTNSIQITYEGVLDLATVLKKIPGIDNLSVDNLKLPITNPSITIIKPEKNASGLAGTWKDATFKFKADQLPTKELTSWLGEKAKSILPSEMSNTVTQVLNAFGTVNLTLESNKFQVTSDQIKLDQVIKAIPGLDTVFTTIPDLSLTNPSLTLSNFNKTTNYQFSASGINLSNLATSLGLPAKIGDVDLLPSTVNLFVSNDRVQIVSPTSLNLTSLSKTLGLPEVITKYIPEIKLDNPQISVIKSSASSNKEISLSGELSGLQVGLSYKNGKWESQGINDGNRLSVLDLVNLLKTAKSGAKQGFYDLVEYQLVGAANLGLKAKTSINGNSVFPSFSFDIAAQFPIFNYGNQQQAEKNGANIKLNNIAIDLGTFISNFLGPIIKEVNEIIEPIRPVIKLLNSDTKLLGELGLGKVFDANNDKKITLLEIAKKLVPAEQKAKLEQSEKFIKAAGDIIDLIEILSQIPANEPIVIDLGSYALTDFKAASQNAKDAAGKVDTGAGNTNGLQTTKTTSDPLKQSEQKVSSNPNAKATSSFFSKLKNLEGLQFPILTNPLKAIDLLLGKTTDLVIYDIPDLDFNFAISQSFPIYTPVYGELSGGFTAKTNLVGGFDTYGINQWKNNNFSLKDSYKVFDGFYLSDWDSTGKDVDELTLTATIAAGLQLKALIADATLRGGIQGTVGLDIVDVGENNGTSDGKIRASEIISRIDKPFELFNLNGKVDAFLEGEIKVFGLGSVWKKEFGRLNLAKFSLGASGFSASGSVSQSYIAAATIIFDTNFNNQWDEGEIKTISDEYGQFNLDLPQEFDINGDGIINPSEGQLLALDGFDTSSGLPSGALIALPDAKIITPLTSLRAKLVQKAGLTDKEADVLVKEQLGLEKFDDDIDTFDPLLALGKGSQKGLTIYLTHIQVQALLNHGRAFLDGLQSNPNNLLEAIASLAKFFQQRSQQQLPAFDLTNSEVVKSFLTFLLAENQLTATDAQLSKVAEITAEGNKFLSQVAKVGASKSLVDALPALASVKRVVQGDVAKLVKQLAEGGNPDVIFQEFQTTLNQNYTFVDADISAFGNRIIRVIATEDINETTDNKAEFKIRHLRKRSKSLCG